MTPARTELSDEPQFCDFENVNNASNSQKVIVNRKTLKRKKENMIDGKIISALLAKGQVRPVN